MGGGEKGRSVPALRGWMPPSEGQRVNNDDAFGCRIAAQEGRVGRSSEELVRCCCSGLLQKVLQKVLQKHSWKLMLRGGQFPLVDGVHVCVSRHQSTLSTQYKDRVYPEYIPRCQRSSYSSRSPGILHGG